MEGSQTDDGFARALAIDSGSALVLGTAGSGRTELLARKAAALACSGVAVERIILLSRTAANRGRLRDRVAELVGGSFEEVWIETWSGLGERLLRDYSLEAGIDPFFEVAAPADRLALLLDRLDDLPLRRHEIRGNPSGLLAGLLERIDALKAEGIGPADLRDRARAAERGAGGRSEREVALRELEFADLFDRHDAIMLELGMLDEHELVLELGRAPHPPPRPQRRASVAASSGCSSTSSRTPDARRSPACRCLPRTGTSWRPATPTRGCARAMAAERRPRSDSCAASGRPSGSSSARAVARPAPSPRLWGRRRASCPPPTGAAPAGAVRPDRRRWARRLRGGPVLELCERAGRSAGGRARDRAPDRLGGVPARGSLHPHRGIDAGRPARGRRARGAQRPLPELRLGGVLRSPRGSRRDRLAARPRRPERLGGGRPGADPAAGRAAVGRPRPLHDDRAAAQARHDLGRRGSAREPAAAAARRAIASARS